MKKLIPVLLLLAGCNSQGYTNGNFYDDPDNLATLGFLSSGYYLNGKLTDKGDLEDVPSLLPIDNIDLTELTEVKEED